MANAINSGYLFQQKNLGQIGKRPAVNEKNNSTAAKDFAAQYAGNFTVELSDGGLSALAAQQKNSVDDSATSADEQKLSATAKDYLKTLREKYGDYDFVIADDMSDPQSLTAGNTKSYSVILSTEEIEKMATDEEYAEKVMGQVDKATGMMDSVLEQAELSDGVQFTSLSVSIDDEGNMKLFASLEKISEEQQERVEKAKEKRAEEEKDSDDEAEELPTASQKVELEADSLEEMLEKIFGIKWDEETEQTA